MSTIVEIPLKGAPKTFSTTLLGVTYTISASYAATIDGQGGWIVSFADRSGNPVISGILLLPQVDLLAQYAYLGIGGQLFCVVDGDPNAVPPFEGLGVTSHLYFVTA